MNKTFLAGLALVATLSACAGGGGVTPAPIPTATPTPIPITPATSCAIGGIIISGPAVVGCGPTSSP